ncbi:hypothetical protein GCM10007285_01180 [Stappia taiwanensis]|nr:hypothetical protein GCM10007285_01180 [Stappia taiwanensis]
MPIQSRSRSPLGSVKGRPLACTRVPGAWPQMAIRAEEDSTQTGRGACGNGWRKGASTQMRQCPMALCNSLNPRSGPSSIPARFMLLLRFARE